MAPISRRAVCLQVAAIATAPVLPLWRSEAFQQPPIPPRPVPFRSSVDLVRLSITARDTAGGTVHDLSPGEFDIYEDGERQQVAHFGHHETPISVVLLLDKSSSMFDEKLMHAKDGVIAFARALKKGDELLVVAFSDSIDALGNFGLEARTIERAVSQIRVEAATRLYDAVIEGAREIAASGRKDKRAILILSDGEDTASRARLEDAVEAIRVAEVPVYAIAIEYEKDEPWKTPSRDPLWRPLQATGRVAPLHRLTDTTGGWTYEIQAARRCKDVCLRVADELRNQYLLGYYPTNERHEGRWRALEVRTTRPGVTLSTRAGYYARTSS